MLRVGDHYFFQIPETLLNSSESMTLEKIEHTISGVSAHTSNEKANQQLNTLKNNQSPSVFRGKYQKVSNAPVKLVPLQQQQSRSDRIQNDDTNQIGSNDKKFKKVCDLRHSFFTATLVTDDQLELFAVQNGFSLLGPLATRVSITASWKYKNVKYRNFKISTDNFGVMQRVHHQKTRWLSVTFKQYEKTGCDDGRVYLETRQEPDDTESCLEALQQYLDNRPIVNPDLLELINQSNNDDADFSSIKHPLIAEIMQMNWKLNVIRVVKNKLLFGNEAGDVLTFNEIQNGSYDINGKFQWLSKHNELEAEINMTNRSNEEICQVSHQFSMKFMALSKREM